MRLREIGLIALCAWILAPRVHAQSRMDQALDAQFAKCRSIQDQKMAEGNAELRAGSPDYGKMAPLMAAERACWADYNELQAGADVAAPQGRYVAPEWSPTYPSASANLQTPPMPASPPEQPFDPGYARRPTPTVLCAGNVMVSGPPDSPDACVNR